ncbi:hypothetical protein GCM10020295_67820 [Streptomyces cinereospinus]
MRAKSSATAPTRIAVSGRPRSSSGTLQAALGVTAFSLTFPATAWGLEGFGPWSLVAVRSVLAALIAGACLLALRVPLPDRRHWPGLAVVACGVVLGFPLLTTLALRTSTTAHAAVVVGLLPLTTALLSALRVGTRPSRTFWARRSRARPRCWRSRSSRAAAPCPPPTCTSSRRCWCAPPATPRAGGWPGSCRAGR